MSTISNSWDSSYYNTNADYSDMFSSLSANTSNSSSFSLSDYASIKNGSYRKLLNAYYAKQDAEKASANSDDSKSLSVMQSDADTLKKATEELMSTSLWEKKSLTETDEKTGEKTTKEDYDWDAITKKVKSFIEAYNDTVEKAGESNSKGVLRNAAWMTQKTKAYSGLLSKAGISIKSDNTLEMDEKALKETDIITLKSLFSGETSYASQINQKASAISRAAAQAGGNGTYTAKGAYSSAAASLVSGTIDKEV